MAKFMHRALATTLVGAGVAFLAPSIRAQPRPAESAAAEALFQQAATLMGEGKYSEACEKFEGSQQLDPALGTMLRLADCYDRTGRTASAWSMFEDVASLARARGDSERQQMANDRANDLEPRLSKLEIKLGSQRALPGLSVTLNGTSLPRAMWDVAIPVDPGTQHVEVTADGRAPWSGSADVSRGAGVKTISVPELGQKAVVEPGPSADAKRAPLSDRSDGTTPGRAQRTAGYVVAGGALLGLGVGAFLTYRAHKSYELSLDHCRPEDASKCSAVGVEQRDDARSLANGATIAFASGGALLVTGIALVLLAPKAEAPPASSTAMRVSANVSRAGGSLTMLGAW
ncbi:MAG TPA: tetratricopeptide repeat protein [Polyangiaceae bacterium]|nr:tetratricopeptide repeat protein [Polyangiaceae bacterium]